MLPSLSCPQAEVMAAHRRRVRRAEVEGARRKRGVRLREDRGGLGKHISGFLPTEEAAYVEEALLRRAEAVGPDAETGTWAPTPWRMADALRDLCAEDLADHESTSGSATINRQPLTDDALERILCDTKIEVHLDEPDGRTVGIGRASRTPPRWLRRRVDGRDHGCCRWPGCSRPIRHVHHLKHWTKGGPTNASNLIGVCWHHHHRLHEGGWNAIGNADAEVIFTSPDGVRELHSRAGPIAA
jgi:hypothetical protein